MSPKKLKPPENLERGEAPIRNAPVITALHFLLGKDTSRPMPVNDPAPTNKEQANKEQTSKAPATKEQFDEDKSSAVENQRSADLAKQADLNSINASIEIEDQLGSQRAGSLRDSSVSQLNKINPGVTQLSLSQPQYSQLVESQLSSSLEEPIYAPIELLSQSNYEDAPKKAASHSISLNWRTIEHTRIPQVVFDEILPSLPPMAQLPYLQLLRLTLGFQRPSCHISLEVWASRCNQSLASIKRQAQVLQQKGLLKKDNVIYGGVGRGSYFRPVIPGIFNDDQATIKENSSSQLTESRLSSTRLKQSQPELSYMKRDHEDHEKRNDHHESRVMMVYQQMTRNRITAQDRNEYQKIAHLDEETIIGQMQQIYERSAKPIGSFAYFARAIEKATNDYQRTRAAQKRNLERIIERVRQNKTGTTRASIGELIDEIKRACIRDNVIYNNDLVNEILGI